MAASQWIFRMTWVDYLMLAASVFLIIVWLRKEKHARLPPGPIPLPVIGNLLLLRKDPHFALHEMSKKYGDIFRLYLGSQLAIVVTGKTRVNEVLSTKSVLFSKRPDSVGARYVTDGKSFSFSVMDVPTHKLLKTIAMTAIKRTEKHFKQTDSNDNLRSSEHTESPPAKTFSTGLEKLFSEEAVIYGRNIVRLGEEYDKKFKGRDDEGRLYKDALYKIAAMTAINTTCATTFGKRYKPEDQQLKFIAEILTELTDSNETMALMDCIPILQKVWKRPINKFIGLCKAFDGLMDMHVKARIKERSQGSDNGVINESSFSVTDNLLQLQKDEEYRETLTDETVVQLASDVFGAGIDTLSITLLWFVVYFGTFPQLRRKVQEEIDAFVNIHHQLPSYNDSNRLPNAMAFITEVARHSSFVAFALPHSPIKDTTLGEYFIPKEASMMVSLWSLNKDQEFWGDPDEFRPSRFLKENNEFDKTLADKVNIHGSGRRRCAGMSTSKLQMFTFATTLLHSFDFVLIDNEKKDLPPVNMSIALVPKTINVKVVERPD